MKGFQWLFSNSMKFAPTASMTMLILLAMELFQIKAVQRFSSYKTSVSDHHPVRNSQPPSMDRANVRYILSPSSQKLGSTTSQSAAPAGASVIAVAGRETRRLKVTFLSVPLNIASYCGGAIESRPWLRHCRNIIYHIILFAFDERLNNLNTLGQRSAIRIHE